jgi:Domain of unknown function (DUF4258)
MKTIQEIQAQFAREEIEFSDHATKQMRSRGISIEELFEAILNAECIETYPEDKYGASVLLLGLTIAARPLHVLVSAFERPLCKVITAYQPDSQEWEYHRIRRPKP